MGKLEIGINDLETYCKQNNRLDLLNEWDYEGNGDLLPSTIAYGSGKKIDWKCSKGHIWQQSPNARTFRNRNCPYCANQLVYKGFNDLETVNPKLAKEWNFEKNIALPSEVINGSAKKYWWLCSKGHTWEATICDRQRGDGCPYCSNKRVLAGYNDLATTHPDLVKEWDFVKNIDISPYSISYGCGKKIWWKCSEGHEYQATPNSRTCNNCGCPYCSGQKVLEGFNDFETWCKTNNQMPLLKEWDFERNKVKPSQISYRSHKNTYWKCSSCGETWSAVLYSRTKHKGIYGCKKCATAQAQKREARNKAVNGLSLLDLYPQIAKEWDYSKNQNTPAEVLSGSNQKVWWICSKGHSYQSTINRRTGQNSGCPFCSNNSVLKGYNDLLTINPELSSEWDYSKNDITPSDVLPMSHLKVWWKCKECGNEWKAVISSRSNGNGCPRCAKELQTSFPEQALFYYLRQIYPDAINGDRHLGKELDIYVPSQMLAFEYDGGRWHQDIEKDTNKNILCNEHGITLYRIREKTCPILTDNNCEIIIVENDTESEILKAITEIFKRLNVPLKIDISKDRTNIYAQYLSIKREKSIAGTHPELLKKWDYQNNIIKPSRISPGSNKKVWRICDKGHHYQRSVNSEIKAIGCPICNGNQVLKGYNDFETWCKQNNRLELLDQWDNEKNAVAPDSLTKSTKTNVWWRCQEGHSYQSYTYLRIKGGGCPYCAGKRVLEGYNDLITVAPEIAEEWDYIKNSTRPSEYTKGSNKKVWWKCSNCGNEWQTSICNRTRNNTGCPVCSRKK